MYRRVPVEGVVSHPVLPPQSDSTHTNHGEYNPLVLFVERVHELSGDAVNVAPQGLCLAAHLGGGRVSDYYIVEHWLHFTSCLSADPSVVIMLHCCVPPKVTTIARDHYCT